MLTKLAALSLVLFSFTANAAGPIASGGVPSTAHEFDAEALTAILAPDGQVRDLLKNSGHILEITPTRRKVGQFSITAETCAVQVRYARNCERAQNSHFPRCTPTVSIEKMVGDCKQ